ncbi:MAG: YciI family protein [Proteobacteria bacterium]|nr:YciI family protein [Pseudomonadota bacterium]
MLYMIQCVDKPNSAELRKPNRPAHLAYIRAQVARILTAGPLLSEDGERMIGSLFVIEAASRADAEEFAAGDPYAKAGVFESRTVRRYRQVFPVERT